MRASVAALLVLVTLTATAVAGAPQRTDGEPATCRHHSSARFPASARDLVVGPLAFVGGRQYSTPETIARFGGQKYPAVVLAGHKVTVELPASVESTSSLLYADRQRKLPDDGRDVADGDRTVTFEACGDRRGGSAYGGRQATFWSGFVLTSVPRCLSMKVWVDDEPPRRVRLPLGRRCPR